PRKSLSTSPPPRRGTLMFLPHPTGWRFLRPLRPHRPSHDCSILEAPRPVDLLKDGFSLLEPALGLCPLVLRPGIRVEHLPVCRSHSFDHEIRAVLVQSHAAKQ